MQFAWSYHHVLINTNVIMMVWVSPNGVDTIYFWNSGDESDEMVNKAYSKYLLDTKPNQDFTKGQRRNSHGVEESGSGLVLRPPLYIYIYI